MWSEGCPWCIDTGSITNDISGAPITNMAFQNFQHFPAMKQLCLMNRRHAEMFPPCHSQRQSGTREASPSVIGLFHRASQQPWQLQRWLSLACFHYKPWHLISLREMGSERWGTRVTKPFSSIFDDALSSSRWCKKCLRVPAPQTSCFCHICLLLKKQCCGCLNLCQRFFPDLKLECWVHDGSGGQFSRCLIKRWCWKWDFGENFSDLIPASTQWSCSSGFIMICITDQCLGLVSSVLWLTAEHWFLPSCAGGEERVQLTSNYCHMGNSEYSPISLNIDR